MNGHGSDFHQPRYSRPMNASVRLSLFAAVISLSTACPQPVVTIDAGGGTGGGEATGGSGGGFDVDSGVGGGSSGGGTATGGGGGTIAPFDAGVTIDLATFCDAWASASCDRESTCQNLDPAQGMTCLARVKDECNTWQRHVTAGVFRYDPAQGGACVAATRVFSCLLGRGFNGGALTFDFGNGPAACDPLLTGVGIAGTPCTTNGDCAAGFTCAGGGTACRTCAVLPTVGQVCNPFNGGNCFDSACRGVSDGGTECVAFAQADQLCTGPTSCDPDTTRGCGPTPSDGGSRLCLARLLDGVPCGMSDGCQSGYCNNGHRTDAGVRTCGTIALGLPCGAQADCSAAAFCNGLTLTTPGLCASRIALGAACTIQRQADPNDGCADGALCFENVCKPRNHQQQLGQSCRTGSLDCAMGGWCPPLPNDAGYPLCTAQVTAGAACASSAECRAGLRCTNNVCQPLASAGQQCFAQQQCKDLLTCPLVDAGMGFFACTPLVSPGGNCTASGTTCASGTDNGQGGFCERDAGLGTCSALLAEGGDCGANAQCASGRCLREDAGVVTAPARGQCQPSCVP
jgi:hypothetical protein